MNYSVSAPASRLPLFTVANFSRVGWQAGPSVSTMGMISQAMSQGRPFGLLTERRSSGGALMETPLSVGLGFGAFTPIDLGSDNLNRALGTAAALPLTFPASWAS